jgi:hypothetical protein
MTNTTADIAAALDTTPRTLRKFLRSEGAGVGKGSRYALPSTKREVNALAKRFNAWGEAQAAKKAPDADTAPEAPEAPADEAMTDDAPSLDDIEHPLDA